MVLMFSDVGVSVGVGAGVDVTWLVSGCTVVSGPVSVAGSRQGRHRRVGVAVGVGFGSACRRVAWPHLLFSAQTVGLMVGQPPLVAATVSGPAPSLSFWVTAMPSLFCLHGGWCVGRHRTGER
jgi:hypothetical protein